MTPSARIPSFTAAMAVALAGCATVELNPPAHAVASGGGAPGATPARPVELQVSEAALSYDMLVDDASAASRVAIWVDVENRDAIANEVDIGGARLIVRDTDGRQQTKPPTASGWGPLGTNAAATRALPVKLAPGERRRGWVIFEAPAPPPAGEAPAMSLFVGVERERPELVLAAPGGGPRWQRPTTGPLRLALSNTFLAGPTLVGDALMLRTTLSAGAIPIHIGVGPLIARRHGHGEVGSALSIQIDLPPRVRPSPWFQATPFVGFELALTAPSFPSRYPGQRMLLAGVSAGIEIGFGTLRPPNADRLPLDYRHPLSPFGLRVAYVRWWGSLDETSIPAAGRSGLLASVTATFGP